jgi:tetratricopeptide (TPR) repeat protein
MKALGLAEDARSERAPDVEGDAIVVAALGLRDSSEPERALLVLRHAIDEVSDRLSPTAGVDIHRILGILLRRTGDVKGAIAAYERAAYLAGDAVGPSTRVLISLGYLQLVQGWLADARATFLRARGTMDRVHLRRDQARVAGNLAHLSIVLGDPAEAMDHLKQALYFHAGGVDLDAQVETLCLCAQAALDAGQDERAAADLSRASALVRAAPSPYDEARVRWLTGRLASRRGDVRPAIASLDDAVNRARAARLVGLATVALAERARARRAAGDMSGSLTDGREALALLDGPAGADFAAEALEALATIAMPGFAEVARRWLNARLDRAGDAEREKLAHHPRTLRILDAIRTPRSEGPSSDDRA